MWFLLSAYSVFCTDLILTCLTSLALTLECLIKNGRYDSFGNSFSEGGNSSAVLFINFYFNCGIYFFFFFLFLVLILVGKFPVCVSYLERKKIWTNIIKLNWVNLEIAFSDPSCQTLINFLFVNYLSFLIYSGTSGGIEFEYSRNCKLRLVLKDK